LPSVASAQPTGSPGYRGFPLRQGRQRTPSPPAVNQLRDRITKSSPSQSSVTPTYTGAGTQAWPRPCGVEVVLERRGQFGNQRRHCVQEPCETSTSKFLREEIPYRTPGRPQPLPLWRRDRVNDDCHHCFPGETGVTAAVVTGASIRSGLSGNAYIYRRTSSPSPSKRVPTTRAMSCPFRGYWLGGCTKPEPTAKGVPGR
jgi:hypothetical protein